jgi:hypothetical protein
MSDDLARQAETDLVDFLDAEAEIEISSAQELTELGKQLRAMETTARRLIRERDALQAHLAEANRALAEWAEVSQRNYQRAKAAKERLAEARAGLAEVVRIVPRHPVADIARATLAKIGGGE